MLQNKKILFIGFGKMGQAIASGLILHDVPVKNISIIDPFFKIETFSNAVNCHKNIEEISDKNFDICIIAIKPQEFATLSQYKNFSSDTIFISIAAGKTILAMQHLLGSDKKIIRAMPNLSATVSKGLTGLYKPKNISDNDFTLAKNIFKCCGEVIDITTENGLNLITSLSGSVPGLIFNLLEIIQKITVECGFSEAEARKIVQSTFYGSLFLAASTNQKYSELKTNVASKGGTTEAGLNVLNENNQLENLFRNAIESAYIRAKELSENN